MHYDNSRNSFTFAEYRRILKLFEVNNYKSVSFDDFDENKTHQLLLRHDVDYLPDISLAKIEKEFNFYSTFFFILTSGVYNPLSNTLQNIFEELHKHGHNIGLHHDSTAIQHIDQPNVKEILKEFSVYSTHKPQTQGMKKNRKYNLEWVYDNKFAWEAKYITDSDRKWKYGHPYSVLPELRKKGEEGRNVQFLTHPIWWHEKSLTRLECYDYLNELYTENTKEIVIRNESDYKIFRDVEK